MKFLRSSLYGMLLLFATVSSCFGVLDLPITSVLQRLRPIQDRIGADLKVVDYRGGMVEVRYRDLELNAEYKDVGPTKRGFFLRICDGGRATELKPAAHPFDWPGYPGQERRPWPAQLHAYPVGHDSWLTVDVWIGSETDKKLVQEILAAISDGAEDSKKFFDRE